MPELPDNTDVKLVRSAVDTLSEHFDTVQIFVTRHEHNEGGTINMHLGNGNWFARYGQIETWVTLAREDTKINQRENRQDENRQE